MLHQISLSFNHLDLAKHIAMLDIDRLDQLDFGVIGFDNVTVVRRYNEFESKAAGLTSHRVLGQSMFTVVAPCMNNFLVAQRF